MKLRYHLLLAALSAALVGLADAIVTLLRGAEAGRFSVLAVGAGALATASLLVGALQAGLIRVARNPLARIAPWFDRRTTRDRDADREPVVDLHVSIAAGLSASALGLGALYRLLRVFESVADESVRRPVTLLAAALVAGLSLVAYALLRVPLRRGFSAFDRRFGLPWPKSAGLRRLLWFVLPSVALLLVIVVRFGSVLGVWAWPFALGLFFFVEYGVLAIARRIQLPRSTSLALLWGLAAALLAMTVWAGRTTRASAALADAPVVSAAFGVLRNLSDVDRDGFSSLYGGGDCAPLSASIAPMRRDVPGNGIDEDCDGSDARAVKDTPFAFARRTHGDIASLGVTPKRYNIVWFMSEATRMDYTTLGGYEGNTTPYLEDLSTEALSFTRAYSQATATMLSVPSMLTGKDPATLRWAKERSRLQPDKSELMLAERLQELGYRTLMISDGYLKARLPGLHDGFSEVRNFWLDGKRQPWYRRAAAVAVSQAISMLEDDPKVPNSDRPFFLFVYLADPHDPYEPHNEGFPNFGRGETGRYAGEIAFTDRYVGFFIDYLRYNPPLWENTIVVFNGDHGEDFREHGTRTHGFNCNRQGSHVPLLVRIPGLSAAKSDANVGLLDVVPTLFEAIGEPLGGMQPDGQSLLIPAFSPDDADPDRPIFCATLLQGPGKDNFFWRGVRSGERALLHDAITGKRELYDMRRDFDEKNNLSGRPEEARTERRLKELLETSLTGNLWTERLVP